ncbi:pterin-4-alpha-carbinolamine dehydratase [Agrococcus baldri]|uniref:Putative pterin-4-alpha-carbinolamine dehydratase n=2 Tax=Agrococcus baldri TaxID=153730 RepID=A0AA94L009_9MICO|nr:pterin-4-alpha-carbinolamine dehydratase [Agrococcus baldri]
MRPHRAAQDGDMSDPKHLLPDADIAAAGLDDWRHADGALHARYASGDFAAGLELVNRIGESAEAADHHPDITLTYPAVEVTLSSHDAGGVTARDIRMARAISEHASALGIAAKS